MLILKLFFQHLVIKTKPVNLSKICHNTKESMSPAEKENIA